MRNSAATLFAKPITTLLDQDSHFFISSSFWHENRNFRNLFKHRYPIRLLLVDALAVSRPRGGARTRANVSSTVQIGNYERFYFPHPGFVAHNVVVRLHGSTYILLLVTVDTPLKIVSHCSPAICRWGCPMFCTESTLTKP